MNPTPVLDFPPGLTSIGVKPDRLKVYLEAYTDYIGGNRVILQLAQAHQVSEPTMRRWAKDNEWERLAGPSPRTPSQIKQRMIADYMAGIDHTRIPLSSSPEEIMQQIAAQQDIADMEIGLDICRLAMKRMRAQVTRKKDPREIKIIVEATRMAVETIRKVRNLDRAPTDPADSYEAKLSALMRGAEEQGLIPALEAPSS